jgi:DNA-binding XRE family transcriptional regulator
MCNYPPMFSYRSRAARQAALFGAGLFRAGRGDATAMRQGEDPQLCIRSALRRRRRALGLTQEEAARLLDMPRLTYHRIESGARRIRFAELAAIATVFHCAVGEFLQDGALAAAFTGAARTLLGED